MANTRGLDRSRLTGSKKSYRISTKRLGKLRLQDSCDPASITGIRSLFTAPRNLPLHEFREHFVWINGDEQTPATRQDFALLIQDFGDVDVLAPAHAFLP